MLDGKSGRSTGNVTVQKGKNNLGKIDEESDD